ncbi:MAG TPA: L-threonylcarbamoyladenylate synthase, partial [Thermoplasmata archaeon]|nr:L-threonylcarbamoyladenylate synthase [Thermoplasmata archaeon]
RAKRRPGGLPLSVAVSSLEELEEWATLTPARRAFIRRYLPGPVTVILPASPHARRALAPGIVGPDGSVGLRIPDHPVARELVRRAGATTSTSANRHGEPPTSSLADARRVFGSEVGSYLGGSPPPTGRPSRLADLRRTTPRVVERG